MTLAAIGLATGTGWTADLTTDGMLQLGTPAAPGFLWRTYQITPLVGTPYNFNETAESLLAGLFTGTTTGSNVAKQVGVDGRGYFNIVRTINFNNDAGDIGGFAKDVPIPGLPGVTGTGNYVAGECLAYIEFPAAGTYTLGVNSDDGFRVTQGFQVPSAVLSIVSPAEAVGPIGCVPSGSFFGGITAPLPASALTAEVVVADPIIADTALNNAAAVNGNICLVTRGVVPFAQKILNAQAAGAVAVIVVNETQPTTMPIVMGGDATGITLPGVMISKADGDRIRAAVAQGPVEMSLGPLGGVELGTFNGGRGTADTTFDVNVPEPGLYPMRVLWYNGDGGANIEWFSVAGGTKVLINDPLNPQALRAYRGEVATNWVAFNDHTPGEGTAANVTGYDLWQGTGGLLTNFLDAAYTAGQDIPVSLGVSFKGGVALAGTMVVPNQDTPAYNLFNGIVTMGNAAYLYDTTAGQSTTMKFTGLDPYAVYSFRTTSVRGRETDTDERWTVSSLQGAISFTDASSLGAVTLTGFPTATMTNGQVAWNSGRNQVGGEVIGWDNIVPSADGTLTIVSERYTGAIPAGTASTGAYGYGPECFMLVQAGMPSSLMFVTQPLANVPGRQGRPFSITVLTSGTAPTYQWYKGATLIPDATLPTYSVSKAVVADAGDYYVVAMNSFGSITSTVAQVAVEVDLVPPAMVEAQCQPSFDFTTVQTTLNGVVVQFSELMDADSAAALTNYSILGPNNTPLAVTAVTIIDGTSVALSTALQAPNTKYSITSTAADLSLNPCTNIVEFQSWVSSPANAVVFEAYNNIDSTPVDNLVNNTAVFPDHPSLVTNLWAFDSRIVYPDDSHEYYGARIRGLFIPSRSGAWRFYVRSDDSSRLFFNPNGPEPAGKQMIIDETGCCGDWTKYESAAFSLVAGQGYYIELLYKEGGGGDYGKVAARLDGTGMPPTGVANTVVDPNALMGAAVGWQYAPADIGGPITITQAPADVTTEEFGMATFTVAAGNASGLPLFYQWRSNGVDIAGATAPSYTTLATFDNSDAIYSVQVAKIGSAVTLEAKLKVIANVTPPSVVSVRQSPHNGTLVVKFSEPVEATFAQDSSHYTVPGYTVTSAVLDETGTKVTLTLSQQLELGANLELTVEGIADLGGQELSSATVNFRTLEAVPGFITMEVYYTGERTETVASLTSSPVYPGSPREFYYLSSANSRVVYPNDVHDAYGARMRGFFIPPQDGNYIFYVRSDDGSEMWFNPYGEDFDGMVLLASAVCCNGFSSSPSAPQPLIAGQRYAIQMLYKEGGGGDYGQMAVKLEDDPTLPNALSPIPGAWLAALGTSEGASVTITEQPANAVVVKPFTVEAPPLLTVDFAQGDGGFIVSNPPAVAPLGSLPPGPWTYSSSGWSCHGQSDCISASASILVCPSVTVAGDGPLFVDFSHRHSFEADSTWWDGGQLRYSVNGGPYTNIVDALMFLSGGYNASSIGGNGIINGQKAFGGASVGYSDGLYTNSVAQIGTFHAGDVISLAFLASWDECSQGTDPNWQIAKVEITSAFTAQTTATFTVDATSIVDGVASDNFSYQWQRDDGDGFVSLLEGAFSDTLIVKADFEDNGAKFRCIVYAPGAVATSEAASLTVTLPLVMTTANGKYTLSWPTPEAGFVLEQSPSLSSPVWTTVAPGSYITTSTNIYITSPIPTTGNKFYRLKR